MADYFVQMRMTGTYTGSKEEITHVQETLSMMAIMTGDHRFEQVMQSEEGEKQGKEIKTMCEVLDRIEEKGKMEGRVEGVDLAMAAMQKLLQDGRYDDAKRVTEDPDYRKQLLKEFV